MDDEYLPDDSSAAGRTAADDIMDYCTNLLPGSMRQSKGQHEMYARCSYLHSQEMLAFVAGPLIKNAAVQILKVAFGDDIEAGQESRRCLSLAETREDDLTQKADFHLQRQRLQEICNRLNDVHSIQEHALYQILDSAAVYTPGKIAEKHPLNICPLSVRHLDSVVAEASRLLTKYPSLAKIYREEAVVVSAYKDFKAVYHDVFKHWEHSCRMRAYEYHLG